MKTKSFFILGLLYYMSCSTGIYPLGYHDIDYSVLIEPTGKSQERFVEFRFSNLTDDTLWYWGHSKNSPIYLAQVMGDSGWAYYLGWCGTGITKIQFAPHKSFKVNVMKPSTNRAWRVGLQIYRDVEGDGKDNWSDIQHLF